MSLEKYKQKRKFSQTPEPSVRLSSEAKKKSRPSELRGESTREIKGFSREPKPSTIKSKNKKLIFLIHRHEASHLHWDLRLEMNGVLKSWAVPKEPPTAKGEKRLAIQVEDHPLAYAKFHGTIPEGNYGAGKVEIWDKGTYELLNKTEKEIEINFSGKKLNGKYVLIKTKYGNKPDKSWLWFRV